MYVNKVLKIGDSLAVSIPADLRRTLEINSGDYVAITLGAEDVILIKKITPQEARDIVAKDIQYGN